jgi:endonuclease/exonuclease/phosphatase family metal-dependent hydrolase
MRMMVYNIRYAAGVGRRFHTPLPYSGLLKRTDQNLKRIGNFIKSLQPDIIGLIEVDSGSYRSKRNNQAESIANELRYEHVFDSKYSSNSLVQKIPLFNKQGNALLTNQQIVNQKSHYFKKGFKRLVIELELTSMAIFLVHLSIKYRHRQDQLKDLYKMIKDRQKPLIVAGDFNAFWGDEELSLFMAAAGLHNMNDTGIPSHPSRSPHRQLDYILHSPEIEVRNFFVPQVRFSDHVPLVCDFDIKYSQRHVANQVSNNLPY